MLISKRHLAILVIILLIAVPVVLVLTTLNERSDSNVEQNSSQSSPASSMDISRTPAVFPVVIAIQPIPRGQLITDDLITIRFWPNLSDQHSDASFETMFDSVEEIIGRLARTDIQPFTPIFFSQIADSPQLLGNVGSLTTVAIDSMSAVVPLKSSNITNIPEDLQPNSSITIMATVEGSNDDSLRETQVITFAKFIATDAEHGIITIAVPHSDVLSLIWAQDNGIPLTVSEAEFSQDEADE